MCGCIYKVATTVLQGAMKTAQWVFLATNFAPSVKTNSFVGVSEDPLRALQSKEAGSVASSKNKWSLEIVIGPFYKPKRAKACCEDWRTKSRGIASRRRKGYELFRLQQTRGREVKQQNSPFSIFDVQLNTKKSPSLA